jgi:hypothetical protein
VVAANALSPHALEAPHPFLLRACQEITTPIAGNRCPIRAPNVSEGLLVWAAAPH